MVTSTRQAKLSPAELVAIAQPAELPFFLRSALRLNKPERTVFNVVTSEELPAPTERPRPAHTFWLDEAGGINAEITRQLHIGFDIASGPDCTVYVPAPSFIPPTDKDKGEQ